MELQQSPDMRSAQVPTRARQPVFVMGCHRSGTNMLYDMLLSAGGFPVYRGYLPIYKMLIPRFGSLERPDSRERIIKTWMRSKGFRRSGLDAATISAELRERCRTGGDFIGIVMDGVARQQGAHRWAVYDPDSVLYVPEIKADIPAALFVHIIRDGRDIAVSLKKMGEFRPIPWNRKPASLQATALYWRWMVQSGRSQGRQFPSDYFEVHYEDLVSGPEETLAALGDFLGQELDYKEIQERKLGRLAESNSSFRESENHTESSPIHRWKKLLSPEQVADIEALIGDCLQECGYELSAPEQERASNGRHAWMRRVYPALLDAKLWMKTKTPMGRLSDLSALEVRDIDSDVPALKP